jgi:hypothetical protein
MTATDTLAMARQLLARSDAKTGGLWPRAAALLTRQALEETLDTYWQSKNLPLQAVSTRPQLICLREYLDDPALAADVQHSWNSLSETCHHHPYELAPSVGELHTQIATATKFQAAAASSGR